MRPILFFVLTCVLAACSDDHDEGHPHTERPAVCEEIGSRCHPFEETSSLAKECHLRAHAGWSEAECTQKKAECFALCTAADGGTDAATDGG